MCVVWLLSSIQCTCTCTSYDVQSQYKLKGRFDLKYFSHCLEQQLLFVDWFTHTYMYMYTVCTLHIKKVGLLDMCFPFVN